MATQPMLTEQQNATLAGLQAALKANTNAMVRYEEAQLLLHPNEPAVVRYRLPRDPYMKKLYNEFVLIARELDAARVRFGLNPIYNSIETLKLYRQLTR